MRGVYVGALVCWAFVGCRTYTTIYGGDAGTCDPPRTTCGAVCVDPSADPQNCGGCGVVCPANTLCLDSSCAACPPATTPCGLGGAPYCAALSNDSANCGACGKVCPQGTTCQNGACACPLTQCGSLCTDTQTDTDNCGTCGHACTTSLPNEVAVCVAGACAARCAQGYVDCNGVGSDGCETSVTTDSANCGACGRSCGADACSSGMCPTKVIASGLTDPGNLSVVGGYLYFTTPTEIDRVPTSGGAVETLVTVSSPLALATDGTYLVWSLNKGGVDARLTSGGSTLSLWSGPGTAAIAIAGANVYYTSSGVWRVPVDGSAQPVLAATGSEWDLVVDSTAFYSIENGAGIVSAPLDAVNATPATIVSSATIAVALAVDATRVYWTEPNAGMVQSAPKGGGNATLLASGQSGAAAIAADGAHVYWAAVNDQAIRRVATGEPLVTLATQTQGTNVAVDGASVYWSTTSAILATVK